MLWLKRNLLLAVSGFVALILLSAGVYYLYINLDKNQTVEKELMDAMGTLTNIYNSETFPHPTNITLAKSELDKVRTAMSKAKQSFTPIPFDKVSGLAFKTLLDNTIFELQKKAELSSVKLPQPEKDYAFSFSTEKTTVTFPAGSFPALPQQLAEVKALCGVLFDAKVNNLISLRRVRVGDGRDASSDYLDAKMTIQTNQSTGVVTTPYQVEFRSFSSELATVLESLYRSPYGLVVKAVMVDLDSPAPGGALVQPQGGPATPVVRPPVRNPDRPPPGTRGVPPGQRPPPANPNAPAAVGVAGVSVTPKEGLQTVLNEKLLKITLLIEVVKSTK